MKTIFKRTGWRLFDSVCRRRHIPQRMKSVGVSAVDYKDTKPFEEIPGPKGIYNVPYIGAMFHFKPFTDVTFDTTYRMWDTLCDKYGSLVRVRLRDWTVLVEDPADIEVVMKTEGKYPKRVGVAISLWFADKYGTAPSVGDVQGEEWHRVRSPLNTRMMRANSAQHYLPVQNDVADDLVAQMNMDLNPEQLMALFYRYACESISVVVYNKRLGYLDPDIEEHPEKVQSLRDIETVMKIINESMTIPAFLIKNFPLKIKKSFYVSGSRLFGQTEEYYRTNMQTLQQQKENGTLNFEENNFMLSLLMTDKFTTKAMASVASTLFFAGTDSTAKNLLMLLHNLAQNPDKQQNLHDEIINSIGHKGPLTEQALNRMIYLPACIKESFRLIFPTSSGTQRYLQTDIVLQGYKIPAGTSVILMNQRTVKSPKYFPEPECYIPERWLRDGKGKRETPIPSSALLPFGFGPRQCLGKRFAEQELYLAITKILQKYEVSLKAGQEKLDLFYSPFVSSKVPVQLCFTERKSPGQT